MSYNQSKINQIGHLVNVLVKKFIDDDKSNLQITKYILRIIGSNVSSLIQDEYTLILAIKNFCMNLFIIYLENYLTCLFIKVSKKGSMEESNEFDKLYSNLSNMNSHIKHLDHETTHSNVRFSILLLLYQLRQKEIIEHTSLPSIFLHSKEDMRTNQLFEGLQNLETPALNKQINSSSTSQLSLEDKLIKDLLFVIQGIDGEHIKYNREKEQYEIEGLELKRSDRILIGRICELGWVFNRIKSYLSSQFNESDQAGLIEQSFKESISSEIKNYYKMVVLLETKLKEYNNSSHRLTLKKFLIWTVEPLKRLKWIAAMLEHSDFPNTKNLNVVVRFHHLSQIKRHGDPKMRLLTSIIEENSALPLISMIKSWIFQGELVDPYSEFFIIEQKSSNEHWERRFLIDGRKLPSHIPLEFARSALEVGKTIVYLKEYLHDYDWIIGVSNSVYKMNKESLETISQLKLPIEQLNTKLNHRLLHLLLDKYEFITHCEAQKRYIYLEQSDFVNAFIKHSSKNLDRLPDKLYAHNIVSSIDMAIKSSSGSSWPIYVQELCDVKLNNIDSAKNGWDAIELTYKMIPELKVIFDYKDNLTIQGSIFKFQWKIKKSLYLLSKVWKYLNKYKGNKTSHINTHHFQILLNSLYSNISNIEYHIIFDVIETSWSSFIKDVSSSTSLRNVIFAYRKYILRIYESISRKYDIPDQKQISLMDISITYANLIEDFENIVKKYVNEDYLGDNDVISIKERNVLIQHEYSQLYNEIMKRMNDS